MENYEGEERRQGNGRRMNDIGCPPKNGKISAISTWAWRVVVAGLLGLLSFNFSDIHSQVHKQLPAKIESVAETHVTTLRFNDFCRRMDRIENKIDRLLERGRNNGDSVR